MAPLLKAIDSLGFFKFYIDCNGKVIKFQSADYRAIMSGKRKDSCRRNPLHQRNTRVYHKMLQDEANFHEVEFIRKLISACSPGMIF